MNKTPEELALEARRRYQREYRAKNKEHLAAYFKTWREQNPDKVAANTQRYWLRKAEEYAAADRQQTENKSAH